MFNHVSHSARTKLRLGPVITTAEILEIDRLVLRDYSSAGHPNIDLDAHCAALDASKFAVVRRSKALAAYAYLWPVEGDTWFVGGIAIHPAQKNPSTIRELAQTTVALIRSNEIKTLKSNVFKANTLSVRLHRHIGFTVTRENDIGYEFTLESLGALQRFAKA